MKSIHFGQDHRLLLQRAVIIWNNCEFGAPEIDCKRPYGNSDVLGDMTEILPGYSEDYLLATHMETEFALQILVQEGRYPEGKWVYNNYRWEKTDEE